MGVVFEGVLTEVDESRHAGEVAEVYVLRLAMDKALAARPVAPHASVPVLGADTAVVIGERVLGKPRDRSEALDMLSLLSDRTHRVLTAVAVLGRRAHTALSSTQVTFGPVSADLAQAYWRTGEPADKAGAYGIQGIGALFVRRIEGSYSGVMGLPIYETAALLAAEGIVPLARGGRRSSVQAP